MSNLIQPVYFSFDIPYIPDRISDFLTQVLENVNKYTLVSGTVKSRIKLILTELCTNFIKHVNTKEGKIHIEITGNSISIIKQYKENSFKKVIDKKINISSLGKIVEIHFSETNNHYIEILGNNKLRFLNPFELGLYSDTLKDHFGLHILTLAADDFFYKYNHKTGEDCFIACINF